MADFDISNVMRIQLSDHFNYSRLVRFTIPTIAMMLFTSIYCAVDGFFISNYAGKTAFSAINLIFPLWLLCSCLAFVFEAGGTAYVSKTLGEGNKEKAIQSFSLFVYTSIAVGVLLGVIGYFVCIPIAKFLGAEGELLDNTIQYIRILLLVLPFAILQIEFHSFFVTAEKPKLGLLVTILIGITNIVLDALLVGYFKLGIPGAAIATDISILIGGGVPLLYFSFPNDSLLKLTRCRFDALALRQACLNGISEFVNSVSGSIVTFLYNYQLMRYVGADGVSAFGIVMYVYFFFQSVFIGYAIGSAPVFGFHFGAKNVFELKSLLSKSLVLILIASVLMFLGGEALAPHIANFFVGYDAGLYELTLVALEVCTFSFLIFGFNIFGSAFFTALSDGITSAKIATLRSVIIEPAIIFILPYFYGKESIWWAIVVGEIVCILITAFYMVKKRSLYLRATV